MPTGNASAPEKLQKAEDLKKRILGSESVLRRSAFVQNAEIWKDCSSLQYLYQELLLSDLEFALEKRVEQDLWTIVFRQQISQLQSLSRDRTNPRINDYAAILKWCLDSASGFYVQLLHSICDLYGFDSDSKSFTKGQDAGSALSRSIVYTVQSCLVHLGDISRYRCKNQLAEHFYRHAAALLPSSGQPFNQLGLLEAAKGDVLSACCFHARSLAVRNPFPVAAANLSKLLAKFSTSETENKCQRLSGSEYAEEFLRFHALLAGSESASSKQLLNELRRVTATLASQLPPLVATENLSVGNLLQMITLDLFALERCSSRNGCSLNGSSLPNSAVIRDHLVATFVAAVLPTDTLKPTDDPRNYFALPVVYILLLWVRHEIGVLDDAFVTRPHVWPSLCHLLNALANLNEVKDDVPPKFSLHLPEEIELRGFCPLEPALASFRRSFPSSSEYVRKGKTTLREERATRIVFLGKSIAELSVKKSLIVSSSPSGIMFFKHRAVNGDQENASFASRDNSNLLVDSGDTPNSQRGSPVLSRGSSCEDMTLAAKDTSSTSVAGIIRLLPEAVASKTRTPGILRIDGAGSGVLSEDSETRDTSKVNGMGENLKRSSDKGPVDSSAPTGFAGRKGGFHNVALQTIMKKSGLLDSPKTGEVGGKQVKFRSPSPSECEEEKVSNGHVIGNKPVPFVNNKLKNLPPRLLAAQMNNATSNQNQYASRPDMLNPNSWTNGGVPNQGQHVSGQSYPRPGFGQSISASITGPRTRNPTSAAVSAPGYTNVPPPSLGQNKASSILDGFRFPPPPVNPNAPRPQPQPQHQPNGTNLPFQVPSFLQQPPPAPQQHQMFANAQQQQPPHPAGPFAYPTAGQGQNDTLASLLGGSVDGGGEGNAQKPPLEAIGSGRVKKAVGAPQVPPPGMSAYHLQTQTRRQGDELGYANGPSGYQMMGQHHPDNKGLFTSANPRGENAANANGVLGLDLEALLRRAPPATAAATGLLGAQQLQQQHMRSSVNRFPQFAQTVDGGNVARFQGPRPPVGGDNPHHFLAPGSGPRQRPPPLSPTKDASVLFGVKQPEVGLRENNFVSQSGLGNLLGGLQGSKYGESGYSLFGFPATATRQQGLQQQPGHPMNVSINAERKRNGEDRSYGTALTAAPGNPWNSLNGVTRGNPLFSQPPSASNASSLWSGMSPFEKLLEATKPNGPILVNGSQRQQQQSCAQKHEDGGQPP